MPVFDGWSQAARAEHKAETNYVLKFFYLEKFFFCYFSLSSNCVFHNENETSSGLFPFKSFPSIESCYIKLIISVRISLGMDPFSLIRTHYRRKHHLECKWNALVSISSVLPRNAKRPATVLKHKTCLCYFPSITKI